MNRIYLKYIAEYRHRFLSRPIFQQLVVIERPPGGSLKFLGSYGVALSTEYSEYDLLPLTPDKEINPLIYRGSDSDHFSVLLYGTSAADIRICADIYNFDTEEHSNIESEDIRVVKDDMVIMTFNPLKVTPRRLMSDIKPLTYKALISMSYVKFLKKLQPFQIRSIQSDLNKFLSLLHRRKLSDQDNYKDFGDYLRLNEAYREDASSLSESDSKHLDELRLEITRKEGFAASNALIFRVVEISEAIDDILKE